MAIAVSVTSRELKPADLQALVRNLSRDLQNAPGIEAAPAEGPAPACARDDAPTLGTIGLAFLTSGAAVAALNVLKAYVSREPSLKVRLKTEKGAVEFDGRNLSGRHYHELLAITGRAGAVHARR